MSATSNLYQQHHNPPTPVVQHNNIDSTASYAISTSSSNSERSSSINQIPDVIARAVELEKVEDKEEIKSNNGEKVVDDSENFDHEKVVDSDNKLHITTANTTTSTTDQVLVNELLQDTKRLEIKDEMIISTSTVTSDKLEQIATCAAVVDSTCTIVKDATDESMASDDSDDDDPYAVDIYARHGSSDGSSEVEVLSSEIERLDSPENPENVQLSSSYGNSLLCGHTGWSSEPSPTKSTADGNHLNVVTSEPSSSLPSHRPTEEEVTKCREGFLQKSGEGFLFWKTRWFVLDSKFLRYYKDEKSVKEGVAALGEISLYELQSVDLTQLNKKKVIILLMSDNNTTHTLTTNHEMSTSVSDEVLMDWIDDIKRMSVLSKSAHLHHHDSSNDSEDDFVVIENMDAMRADEDNNLFFDRQLLHGGDDLLSNMTKIANEKGLDAQNYQCVTCSTPIGIIYEAPRMCMFTANYYCSSCHINDETLIPARIVHNWDFRKHKVSKSSKDFMTRNWRLPCINLNHVNPAIYHHLSELRHLLKLRERLVKLDPYFKTCRFIKRDRLNKLLLGHHHMMENAHTYTAHELTLIPGGHLEKVVANVVEFGVQHVKSCTLCSAKGFICEICRSNEVIFSFDDERTYQCDGCHGLFHKTCFSIPSQCPRCKRKNARFEQSTSSSSSSSDEEEVVPQVESSETENS